MQYQEVALRKLGFVVRLPSAWQEDPHTADPNGPVDYQEFLIPMPASKKRKDSVVGTFGFRVVPRIAKNTLVDEVLSLKSYVQEAAEVEGSFEEPRVGTMGKAESLELVWHGTRKDTTQTWRYTLAFIDDDLFVTYYLDEDENMARWKGAYDLAVASVERR